jgi:hypothetical protein
MRKVQGWLFVLWIFPGIPISIYLKESVAYLVFLSVYTIVMSHLISYQESKAEEKAT